MAQRESIEDLKDRIDELEAENEALEAENDSLQDRLDSINQISSEEDELEGFPFHGHHGGYPLSKSAGSSRSRIVLSGPPAHAERLHDMGNFGVATSTSRAKVIRC